MLTYLGEAGAGRQLPASSQQHNSGTYSGKVCTNNRSDTQTHTHTHTQSYTHTQSSPLAASSTGTHILHIPTASSEQHNSGKVCTNNRSGIHTCITLTQTKTQHTHIHTHTGTYCSIKSKPSTTNNQHLYTVLTTDPAQP